METNETELRMRNDTKEGGEGSPGQKIKETNERSWKKELAFMLGLKGNNLFRSSDVSAHQSVLLI